MLLPFAIALCVWESLWWQRRVIERVDLYTQALRHARAAGKRLIILGAPDAGATRGPGCGDPRFGDVVVDVVPSACPNSIQADVTKRLPFADDSAVVFVSCVLEYVSDYPAAVREIQRIAQDRVYVVRVEPWTLASVFYPGAKRVLSTQCLRRPTT